MEKMMDSISRTNRERWNALARANVEYSRPFLNFTAEQAAQYIYRHNVLPDVRGKKVLCLASGGGQDSVAFGLLGAEVTVLDISDEQLERDRQAADKHGLNTVAIQGDMRDLSIFAADTFDIVWQMYSLNFVPTVEPAFSEVARVLKSEGYYLVQFANPFTHSVDEEAWNGNSYPLKSLYIDGEDIIGQFPHWDVRQEDGNSVQLDSPHEFRHRLSTVMNALANNGFIFVGLWEWMVNDPDPHPGTWAHFTQVAPPWFETFWRLRK
jgi:SAM-dependent methyltransferase